MCGITGILSFTNDLSISELKDMTDVLVHRGPDGEGQWIDNSKRIGLGHRRLSILDLSNDAAQPMHSECMQYSITFNGEIYNYIEIREKLKKKGYNFRTSSDTEVLLYAYQEYGKSMLENLDGMFAFVIWDDKLKELFCARDRFGEKPFFYYKDKNRFVFASEMKAIFANKVLKSVNHKMLFNYLAYDLIENPKDKSETFYYNIKQIPASHFMLIKQNGECEIERYWNINSDNICDISFEDAICEFQTLFRDSIKKRMRSDVEVGSSLSGGVDSSSIVCTILDLFPNIEFNTYTARFHDINYDEGRYINTLSKEIKLNIHECFPSQNTITKELDKIFYHQEEPFGSLSIIAQWEVMKLAKEKNTIVLLDGQGADEVFAGYFKYYIPYLYEIRRTKMADFKKEEKAIENHLGVASFLTRKDKYRMISPSIYDNLANVTRKYRKSKIGLDLNKEFKEENFSGISLFHRDNNLNNFLYNDIFKYGLGKLLRFSDRNAMAHSREVRLPYLSHKIVEFIFSLPASYKINNGWTKYILRKSMEDIVPKSIIYRKDKKGFQAPPSLLNNDYIDNLINDSISKLQEMKIVNKPDTNNPWKYIMASKLFN